MLLYAINPQHYDIDSIDTSIGAEAKPGPGSHYSQPGGDKPDYIGCYYFPPGPRLPFWPQGIAAIWPILNYTPLGQRHVCVCVCVCVREKVNH